MKPPAAEFRVLQDRPVISCVGLHKAYESTTVVDGIDLKVMPGQCFGLLGPNGAGKTTILRMLLGLTPPDRGELTVLGYSVPAQARRMRQYVGMVPQMDNLDPDFTVRENFRVYASYFGISGATLMQRIEQLLKFASLEARANARINDLSGGMKRRLILARALVNDPQLLILDEPTTGLDPQARQLIWQRLRSLLAEGRTLILTTHYMDEAQRLCDRLIIMDHGRVLTIGSPAELIKQHIEPHVLEIHGQGLDDWLVRVNKDQIGRIEHVGDTAFCYVSDERALIDNLMQHEHLQFLHRRANLEDVFLKLTGRELRE